MIRYEYEEEDPIPNPDESLSPKLDLNMEDLGDIDEFFADPNFQALVNETPWLQNIANEFYESADIKPFFDDDPHRQGSSQETSQLTQSSSQIFSQPLETRVTKIESMPLEDLNEDDLFMNENMHHDEFLEYHQPGVKKLEEFDQPQHSRAHAVQVETHGFQALKPRNEEPRPTAPVPPAALSGRAPLLTYGSITTATKYSKTEQVQNAQPKVVEERKYEGFGKPSYSYSCLIGLALKNSAVGQLTVSEIYAFMCEHFPYFRGAPSGWKNSVRHNLSLNKCFQKIEVDEPGCHGRKSCLWRLNPNKQMKMDQEIRKWRERHEKNILSCMVNPADLDLIEAGKKGMPASVRKRPSMEKPVINMTWPRTITQPKIIRRPTFLTKGNSNFKILRNPKITVSDGETVRQAAARNLEQLLHQRSAPIIPNYRQSQNTIHTVHKTTNGEGKTTVIRVTSSGRHTQTFNSQVTSMPTSIPSDVGTSISSSIPPTTTSATIRIGGITVRTADCEDSQPCTSNQVLLQQPQSLPTTFPILNQRPKSPEYNFSRINENMNIKIEDKQEVQQRHDPMPSVFSPIFYYDMNLLSENDNRTLLEAPIGHAHDFENARSLSPLHFASCAYETVTNALNDNSLLQSALAQSPSKSNI